MQVVDFLSSPKVSARPLRVLSCSSVTWGPLALPSTCMPTHLVTQQNKSPQVKNTTFILSKFGDHLFLLTYSPWELHLYPTTMPCSPQLTFHFSQPWEEFCQWGFSPVLLQNHFVNSKVMGTSLLVSGEVKGGGIFERVVFSRERI